MSIVLRDVWKYFGEFTALAGIDLEIPDGSLMALLGPSGSGKSTLLRVIAGLESPDSGEVFVAGQPATALPPQRRGVGFVFQHYAAFRHMTVRQNVAFGLRVRRRPRPEIRERVDELLELVGLGGWADRYPAQLSGGQRQRMALARALAVRPRVLLLDEPFGALDANVRGELRAWLRRLHDEMRVTTVLVTHDQQEAMEVADRLAVINGGRLEQVGPPSELYEHPASGWVMRFLGPVNEVAGREVRPHQIRVHAMPTDGAVEAIVARLAHLGSHARLDMTLGDGAPVQVQLSHARAQELELAPGDIVYLEPRLGLAASGPGGARARAALTG